MTNILKRNTFFILFIAYFYAVNKIKTYGKQIELEGVLFLPTHCLSIVFNLGKNKKVSSKVQKLQTEVCY